MKDDNQFKSELQKAAYQEEITPPAAVWHKLATAMPPQGKRTSSPWRLALLLLLLLVSTTAIIFRYNEPMQLGAFVLNAHGNNHTTGTLLIDHDHQSNASMNEMKGDRTTATSNNKGASNSESPKDNAVGQNPKGKGSHSPTPIAMNAHKEKTTAQPGSLTEEDHQSSQPSELTVQSREKSPAEAASAMNDAVSDLVTPSEDNELAEISREKIIAEKSATILNPIPLWFSAPLLSQQQNQAIRRVTLNKQTIEKSPRCRMYTDAYIGGGWAARSLSADAEMSSYLNLRAETEQDLSWFESGIRVGTTARRWRFDIGLQYGQINAYMQHTYYGYPQIVAVEVTNPTGTIRIDSVLRYGTRERIVQNTYRDISIPLRIGYQFYQGRIGVTAYAGVNPVFGLPHRGVILSPNESDYHLQADPEAWFDSGMRWYGTAQIQLSVPLSGKVAILLDMGLIHDFNGIHSERNPIEQRYNILRGSAGVRYFFDRQATICAF